MDLPSHAEDRQLVKTFTAKFTVTAFWWYRYRGQMSRVPPERSTRHGDLAKTCIRTSLADHSRAGHCEFRGGFTMEGMPARRILQLARPRLRVVSEPVRDPASVRLVLRDLDSTLAEFRRTHGFGRGISAIQIGEAVRVIFLRFAGKPYELINPEYVSQSAETFELWDDCFSFPNLMVRLRRHARVVVKHQDVLGHWHEFEAAGDLSS